MKKELPEFNVSCKNESCRSQKLYSIEGKTYHIEETPQKMLFFNTFTIGSIYKKLYDLDLEVGTHSQYYCPVCFSIKTIVTNKAGEIVDFYEDIPEDVK